MVCLIINGQDLPHQRELVEKLCEIPGMTSISLNMNKKRSNVILGDKVKTIWEKIISQIRLAISHMKYHHFLSSR